MPPTLPSTKPIIAQQPTPITTLDRPTFGGIALWIALASAFFCTTLGLLFYIRGINQKHKKEAKLNRYKINDLKKKLKLALNTIKKMESNPDLVHSREFNLDYLRMRMEEDQFHYVIVNQLKIKVRLIISVALRPSTADVATVGIATSGRPVDEIFDVYYDTINREGQRQEGVLFRVNISLTKLPAQASSITVEQIIDCLEKFLNPSEAPDYWQPTVQGRVVTIEWDQKAKPTPLLLFKQSEEGDNVSFRSIA
ncbi:hypothetical protein [Synechococcus sp. BDU 130192]|uniref:hypothetical protein n=1 Tax=Synechococcus sp. BDU 130192 TaxID=2042059 RepID=UPI000C086F5F|nr:hypothetical protein [Synechococcus sp. BDU 130192]